MFIFYTCITNRMANAPEATLESTSTSEPARSFQDNRQESSFKGFWPLFNKPDRADFKCTSGAIHATSKPLYSCKHAPILTKQNVCQQVHVQSHESPHSTLKCFRQAIVKAQTALQRKCRASNITKTAFALAGPATHK